MPLPTLWLVSLEAGFHRHRRRCLERGLEITVTSPRDTMVVVVVAMVVVAMAVVVEVGKVVVVVVVVVVVDRLCTPFSALCVTPKALLQKRWLGLISLFLPPPPRPPRSPPV